VGLVLEKVVVRQVLGGAEATVDVAMHSEDTFTESNRTNEKTKKVQG
jgi:hypothetical protein